jgi:zinc transport system substrate-binding protein
MNNKQKTLLTSIILIAVIAVGIFAFSASTQKNEKLSIVSSFYPLTFLIQEIGGDQIQVTQLAPSNTEIHGWEPSASHIVAAEDSDIIVYNGAGLDHWMEDDVLPALSNSKTRTVVESTLGLELLLGEEHDEHEEETEAEQNDHGLYDPHTWVSPYMAKLQAEKIYDAIIEVDPNHESYYTKRWLDLKDRLSQLDGNYSAMLLNASKSTIFVSHEAFGYLADRYGFKQRGVIGLSSDEQPSAATIASLIDEMEEHETYVVYVDPVYSREYVETIKLEVQARTGQTVTILNLYLMLGPTDLDLLEQMDLNLDNLAVGLEAGQQG